MALLKKLTLGAIAGILVPASLFAGPDKKATVEPTPAPSILTGDLGINFVSEYISRGVMQENQGAIAEPYLDLFFNVYEAKDSFVDKVTLNLSAWSSFHSHHPYAPQGNNASSWYECDIIPGVSVTFLKNWTVTASYLEYFAPNHTWTPNVSRNLNFNLAYNDTDLLGAFALHPHIAYLRELQGNCGSGLGWGHGNYYELGVAPALPAYGPLTVTFPVNLGLGSNGFYYQNRGFGYFNVGVNGSVALTFIPTQYGAWAFNTGVTYWRLGNENGTDAGYDNNRFVWQGGLGVTF